MNCKPGDLAYIADAHFAELIGLVVQVCGGSCADIEFGFCWHVRASRPVSVWDNRRKRDSKSTDFMMPDADLRPISGVPVYGEVSEDLKEPA